MNYQSVYKIIDSHDYISFDIFDTLIKRDVPNPEDVFLLMQEKINRMNIKIDNFREKRKKAEQKARKNLNKEEISIIDIYSTFKNDNKEYNNDIIDILRKSEEDLEVELSINNSNIRSVLEYCIEQNKQIILTSDMYLSKDIINKILTKNNINKGKQYCKLYISSEYGVTKKSGKLFDIVLNDLGICPSKLAHIGDAWKSDYIIPMKKGIKAYHISTAINNTSYKYLKTSDKELQKKELWLDKFISNRVTKFEDEYERFGYECLGPLVYGFSIWLYEKLKKEKYKYFNFLSREGQFLNKAFNIIYSEDNTRYICVSRKSIIGALLCTGKSLEDRLSMIQLPHAFNKKVVLDLLGVDKIDCTSSLSDDNIIYHTVDEIIKDSEFFALLKSIDNEIVSKSENQMELLKTYLKFDEENHNICIIDIGWNGTMQYYLSKLLSYIDCDKSIQGYYMGVSKVSKIKYKNLDNFGYLFEKENNYKKIDENKLFSFCGLFESLFTADHGSVKKYFMNNEEVKPMFYKYEYENNYKVISKIQDGALEFVRDYKDCITNKIIKMDSELVSSKILRVGNYPNKKELEIFGSLDFFDVKRVIMAGKLKLFSSSIKDIHNEFLISGWKVGFIKRLIFKFPASKFYCKYRERINKVKLDEQSVTS